MKKILLRYSLSIYAFILTAMVLCFVQWKVERPMLMAERFLMTGKLHLPVPLMILSGPIFRGQISFMPVLFISTLIISGPAWCSQLCYFGALDNMAAKKRTKLKPLQGKFRMKHTGIVIIIALTLVLRFLNVSTVWTTLLAGTFGVAGLAIIVLVSGKRGKMVH